MINSVLAAGSQEGLMMSDKVGCQDWSGPAGVISFLAGDNFPRSIHGANGPWLVMKLTTKPQATAGISQAGMYQKKQQSLQIPEPALCRCSGPDWHGSSMMEYASTLHTPNCQMPAP